MDNRKNECVAKPIMLWPLDSCHRHVPTEGLEKRQPSDYLRSQQQEERTMEMSVGLGHLPSSRVIFDGSAFQLSSGKEHGVCLSAGNYLDKQENILPPNLIGTGILLSIWWLKQHRALQNISDQLASLEAGCASVRKHIADRVSVLTSLQHLLSDETH